MPPLDALAGPLLVLTAAAALPQLTGRLVRLVLHFAASEQEDDRGANVRVAFGILNASQMLIAWMAGRRALGPALLSHPDHGASLAFGLLVAAVAWTSLHLARPSPWPSRTAAGTSVGAGALLGIALGGGLFGLWGALDRTSAIAPDELATTSPARARLRRLLVPWEPAAVLALGWEAVAAEDVRRGRALLEEGARVSAPREELLRLEAALAAIAGDCPSARRAFEAWLAERTARAFAEDRILRESLSLDDFRPPPAYLARCGSPPEP